MKEGYTLFYYPFDINDNCVLVYNYEYVNQFGLCPFFCNELEEMKTDSCVGIWKIKHLK